MDRAKCAQMVAEVEKAKVAINEAMNKDYGDKNIKMYLENAIAYLQNAKKLTR